MNFDMYTMERRLEMTLPVQTNLNTSIGSTRLVTFTEHTVNTYIFPLLLPNHGKIHLPMVTKHDAQDPTLKFD
jgi:hypothetical protein